MVGRLRLVAAVLVVVALEPVSAAAQAGSEHPLVKSRMWLTSGSFVADRNFDATAGLSAGGDLPPIDFENSFGFESSQELFMAEFGWQFSEHWGLALQRFSSQQSGTRLIDGNVEWQGNLYEAGVQLDSATSFEITRFVFFRSFRDHGPHHLKIGAGLHWISTGATVAGVATLEDQSREFRRSVASADFMVPNIGVWYFFSNSENWLLSARADWLSASGSDWSGRIWNVSAGGSMRISDHFGIGLNYQYFELSGDLTDSNWRGVFAVEFSGPYLYLSVYW